MIRPLFSLTNPLLLKSRGWKTSFPLGKAYVQVISFLGCGIAVGHHAWGSQAWSSRKETVLEATKVVDFIQM